MTTSERLRAAGFRIVSRPANGEPTWRRGSFRCKESVALGVVRIERERAAKVDQEYATGIAIADHVS